MIEDRKIWIDLLKGAGILAVILGHINSPLGSWIYSWHMPFFFFLAGFFALASKRNLSEQVAENARKLMIPYFLFSGLGVLVEICKRVILHKNPLHYRSLLEAIFLKMDLPALLQTYGFVLWFLPTLFFARLFFLIASKNTRNPILGYAFIVLLFFIGLHIELPFALDNAAIATLWLLAGSIYFQVLPGKRYTGVMLILLLGISIWYGIPLQDFASKHFSNLPINLVYSLASISVFAFAARSISIPQGIQPIITQWGANTMLLFILHPYTNNVAHLVVTRFVGNVWYAKLALSLLLLQLALLLKQKKRHWWVFRYV